MASFDSKYVVCPFYHRFESNRICCEGLEERNTINLVFEDPRRLNIYRQKYCCNMDNYKWCLIHATLERKYSD